MTVYRISKCAYISDLSGMGAAMYSGRWHHAGTYILYTAATPSLAMLETIAHLSAANIDELCLVCIELPGTSLIKEITLDNLPADWYENPSPDELRNVGDAFVLENKYLALRIPSAVMPEESNYLLNPEHPDFKDIKIRYIRNIHVDERLLNIRKEI